MTAPDTALLETDIEAYLLAHERKSLLRFLTCGSVDDGKSTLIGRLLYESHQVFEDQLAALEVDSKRSGTQGGDLDFALLIDGLSAEREQGITIDVAYRYFTTEHRKFIVADTPGHEQYTRNMVTGASTADLAVILVDARRGVLTQTRRHSFLVALLGIRHVVVAVNKLDLVGYDERVFAGIERDYRTLADQVGLRDVTCIPVSALKGDNIVTRSEALAWYDGPALLEHLESVDVEDRETELPFRMPVQWVNRPDLDFRGFCGLITGGRVSVGAAVKVLPSGRMSTVAGITTFDGDLVTAVAGQSVTLTMSDEIDISRGDLLVAAAEAPAPADHFEAHVVWMHEDRLVPGKPYLAKVGAATVGVTLSAPRHRVDVNTMAELPADTLELNEIGVCRITADRAVPWDPYEVQRDTGGLVVVDRLTNATVGIALLREAVRRTPEVHWQSTGVTHPGRAGLMGHAPGILWFTGLSGSGKSTIADRAEQLLHGLGVHTYLLDGDNVRHGLSKDLGFTVADRVESVRRVAEVARLMADAGLVVLVSLISPFRSERKLARELAGGLPFCEVFVDAPLEVAEQRDPKGLYRRARGGELPGFTGIDSPYEPPALPDVRVDTTTASVDDAAQRVVDWWRGFTHHM